MTDYWEHIDDYLGNNLSPEAKLSFENALKSDKKLESAVENYDKLKSISSEFLDEEVRNVLSKLEAPKKGNTKLKYVIILVAIAVLGLISYLYQADKKSELLYAEVYEEPAWPIRRSVDNSLSDAIKLGMDGNIEMAKQKLLDSGLETSEQQYWIAELFASKEMADSTLAYLPKSWHDNIRRDRINYLEILSYIKKGQNEKAKQLIDALPPDTDDWYIKKLK